MNYTLYFGHSGNLGKLDTNTSNKLGYTENITRSPTPNSASDKVYRLNFHSTILCDQSDFVIHFNQLTFAIENNC